MAGRPRKPGPRHPSGRPRSANRATERAAHAIRLQYRYRDLCLFGISYERASQAEWTVLGILREVGEDRGGISDRQYWAGSHWCWVCHRHARVLGYAIGRPAQLSLEGRSLDREPTDEEIAQVRDDWRLCHDALCAAARLYGERVLHDTYNSCVLDRPPRSLQALNLGLNALCRVLDARGRRA
jgi:hypothetical protein